MPARISDEFLERVVAHRQNYKSDKKAGDAWPSGPVARETFRNWMSYAAQRGIGVPIPEALPPGFLLKGTSTLYDKDGKPKLTWVKTKDDPNLEEMHGAIRDAFSDFKGKAPKSHKPKDTATGVLTTYPIVDAHLGLRAYTEVTGAGYNLDTAVDDLKRGVSNLVKRSVPSTEALILNLGDYQHANDKSNRTPASGHLLDVEGSDKVIKRAGVDLMIRLIWNALERHEIVHVVCIEGNHDPDITDMLRISLGLFFANEPRVNIIDLHGPHYVHEFGKTMLFASHGHLVKPPEAPGTAAAYWPEMWGRTLYRYALFGHFHHTWKGKDVQGMEWEVFSTMSAKDAYAYGHGYSSKRGMTSITYSDRFGEQDRHVTRPWSMS